MNFTLEEVNVWLLSSRRGPQMNHDSIGFESASTPLFSTSFATGGDLRALLWLVNEGENTAVESRHVDEVQVGSFNDALEKVLALADCDGRKEQMELVDKSVLDERDV